MTDVLAALVTLGGVARRSTLVDACGRRAVAAAIRDGAIVPVARGTWTSREGTDRARAAAVALHGVLSHRSAALAHGWAVHTAPSKPEITVARSRRIAPVRHADVLLHRADLAPDDLDGHLTSADRTLVDCLRSLPFAEALAVADSALRSGFRPERLLALARDARGPGSPQVRRVAALADGRAANPFESALRAICLGVGGLEVVPQLDVFDPGWLGRPDLVSVRLRVVLEADSFEWHGRREALERDARRYNAFVAAGWLILRFTWSDVMFRPDEVARTLASVVERRTEVLCPGCRAA